MEIFAHFGKYYDFDLKQVLKIYINTQHQYLVPTFCKFVKTIDRHIGLQFACVKYFNIQT